MPTHDDEKLKTATHKRRWRVAMLLGVGVLVNYFDRVNLSVSHAALHADFGISDSAFGYLSGTYNWTYALCQLPMGMLLDRYGVRLVGRVSTFIWSVASFAAAGSPTLSGLFGARLLLGVGEASTFPSNAKAIGYWFPAHERGLATAIFDGAAKFASAIGVPLLGILLLKLGWRWSFAFTGVISLLYFFLFSKVYCDPKDDPELTEEERREIAPDDVQTEVQTTPCSLGYLLKQPKVLGLSIGFGAYNYVFYLLLTWLPSYLSSALHVDLLHSFLYTSVPWLFATFTDFVAGWGADALIQRGWDASKVRKAVLVVGTSFGLGILGATHAHTPASALFWISMSIGGLSAASPVGWSIPSMIAPHGRVGTVGGIVNLSNQISGIAAPIITGLVVSATHAFTLAFVIPTIYLLIGIAAYVFMLGRIERIAPEPAGESAC